MPQIDRLAEVGHVERRRDLADRRTWNIYLTDRSRPLLDQLRALGKAVVADALAGLSPVGREALTRSLDRIRDNLSPAPVRQEAAHG